MRNSHHGDHAQLMLQLGQVLSRRKNQIPTDVCKSGPPCHMKALLTDRCKLLGLEVWDSLSGGFQSSRVLSLSSEMIWPYALRRWRWGKHGPGWWLVRALI